MLELTMTTIAEQIIANDAVETERLQSMPQPEPLPIIPEPPQVEKPRIEIRPPWLTLWCVTLAGWIATPWATLAKLALLPIKAWSLIRVAVSRRVEVEEYAVRQHKCSTCALCVLQVRKSPLGAVKYEAYCGGCGCPKWRLSRLRYKNRKAGWQCPRGLHDETVYDVDRFVAWAADHGFDDYAARWKAGRGQTVPPVQRKGCGG
jgi:hypothetical protein